MSRFREGVQSTAQREALGVTRATMVAADDSKKMQELRVEMMHSEARVEVEHWQPYGFFSVPLPPKDGKEAEVLLAHVGGSRSHAVAIATADRRYRPRNAKPGETGLFDDLGKVLALRRDKIEVASGDKPFEMTFGAMRVVFLSVPRRRIEVYIDNEMRFLFSDPPEDLQGCFAVSTTGGPAKNVFARPA